MLHVNYGSVESVLNFSSAWEEYNKELLNLSDVDKTTGVVIAPGAGHFIQRDNPQFIATQLATLLEKVQGKN